MNDFSDLIMLMGAMILFSLLTIQTSRLFLVNNQTQIDEEIKHYAISVAQDHVDRARWIKGESSLNNYVSSYPKQVSVSTDDGSTEFTVSLDSKDINIPGSNVTNKQLTVTVRSNFLEQSESMNSKPVELQLIKSFAN
ncbi:hypothetical protein LX73_0971 [Fodinibius salinus]|uniref:Uncharacterized protein n=1 Tax=Fodinibius salinus TaxID=860790 RepID=A0A5D3YND8_9BACT|nr:hypothetical protein [Fodinibius salinus]TYP95656.1 hypothetical protein LX73_0971 [Fodinibius salinus]